LKCRTDEHDRGTKDDASLPTKLVTNNEDHNRACKASDPEQVSKTISRDWSNRLRIDGVDSAQETGRRIVELLQKIF
jgi:hypothetical protein